jgi:hypothetical protein
MKAKDLILELSKLPQEEEIYFCSYDNKKVTLMNHTYI